MHNRSCIIHLIIVFAGILSVSNWCEASGSVAAKPRTEFPEFTRAIKAISPSLVRVRTFKTHVEPGVPAHYHMNASGSGTIITADGFILTNFHVIENGDRIEVLVDQKKYMEVRVVGYHEVLDLALIKVDLPKVWSPLTRAIFADPRRTEPGQWVLKGGFPGAVKSGDVPVFGHGIISNLRTFVQNLPLPFAATDTHLSGGDSGGPLVNLRGEVVGIDAAVVNGIGHYIPTALIQRILPKLHRGIMRTGWIGITPDDCVNLQRVKQDDFLKEQMQSFLQKAGTPFTGANEGIVIMQFADPAAGLASQILIGDIITHVNGEKPMDEREFIQWVCETEPGEEVLLRILRKGTPMLIHAKVSEFKEPEEGKVVNAPE